MRITGAGLRESHVHDVMITRESAELSGRGVILARSFRGARRANYDVQLHISKCRIPGSMLRIAGMTRPEIPN